MTAFLSSDSSMPLYRQLASLLEQSMDNGEYPSGSKLPTEFELSERYHVSRVTVRKALSLLEQNNEIERKTGKGTYVAEKKLKRNLSGKASSFTRMCQQMGTRPSSKTIRIALEEPSPELRAQLHLKAKDQLLVVERVRYSDDQPVMIERDYLPEDFSFLFSKDLDQGSLYEIIAKERAVRFTQASRSIDIVFANASEARYLSLKTGYPLLRIYSVTQDDALSITTVSEQLCVGDKFKLQI